MAQIIAQKFLNNEIRLRLVAKPPSKAKHKQRMFVKPKGGFSVVEENRSYLDTRQTNLDLISEFQRASEKVLKGGWGKLPRKTRFNKEARHKIIEAGSVIDRQMGGKSLMLTGTLPGSTDEAMKAIAEWSGYIVNRLQQWLRRRVEQLDAFYAWEWQSRGALHIHYVVAIQDDEVRKGVAQGFKAQWIKILKDVCYKSGADLFEKRGRGFSWIAHDAIQADAAEIVKSASAYISKYVGKDESKGKGFKGGKKYYPARWWGLTRGLRDALMEGRESLGQAGSDYDSQYQYFQEIAQLMLGKERKCYWMKDKYHPDNLTLIAYFDDDLLSATWQLLDYKLTRISCNIEAKLMTTNKKIETPAWNEIRSNYRMRKRAIAEAMATGLYGNAWLHIEGGLGHSIDPEYKCTYLELWEMHCSSWLPTLRRLCK